MSRLAPIAAAWMALAGPSLAVTKHPVNHPSAHKAVRSRRSATAGSSLQGQPTPERYKDIQQALAAKGYYRGQADGKWNGESADALKRFQADQNLASDGKLNSLSLIALGLGPKRSPTTQPGVRP